MGGDIDNNIKMLWILLLQIDFYEVLLYIKFNVSPTTLSAIEELFCGKKNVKKSAIPCKCNLSRDACAFVVTQFSFLFNNNFFPSKFHFFERSQRHSYPLPAEGSRPHNVGITA